MLATVASLVLASWLDEAVRRVLLPRIIERTSTSAPALWAALGAGVIAAIVGSIANTRQVPRRSTHRQLSGGRPAVAAGHGRMTALLLVQMTLSVMLLAGAGMFGGSLYRLLSQDFGMEMSNVLLDQRADRAGWLRARRTDLPRRDSSGFANCRTSRWRR